MAADGRIDVHHHVLPEFYIEAQKSAGIRFRKGFKNCWGYNGREEQHSAEG